MALTLTQDERTALEAAQQRSAKVRHWWRYQAVLLRYEPLEITGYPSCSRHGNSSRTTFRLFSLRLDRHMHDVMRWARKRSFCDFC